MRVCVLTVLVLFGIGSKVVWPYQIADTLRYPLDSYVVGANYFGRYDLVRANSWHLGDDVAATAGTNVFAIGNGIVRRAQVQNGYGGTYIIEHDIGGEKVCALYTHLNFATFTKAVGQEVIKGEYLGQVGNSDQNGGWPIHFHFGIRKGAYPADPNAYIYGDWIFSGYTYGESVLDDWHNPSTFIAQHQSSQIIGHWKSGEKHANIWNAYQALVQAGNSPGQPFNNGSLEDGLYVHRWYCTDFTYH
jgi:hypothetical protein